MTAKLIGRYEEISHYQYPSGLQLLIWPYPVFPSVVGTQVTYDVGSVKEVTGITGAAHLLEHLMFKGSEGFDSTDAMNIHALEDRGAILNATTWMDRTNYYEVLPKEEWHLAMAIEASRMQKAFLREEDRAAEMTVVRNEYERGENDPLSVLYKYVWAMSYLAHPYHHSTIGWRSDIENMSIEAIRAFYQQHYAPNRAVITVVGDVLEEEVVREVEKHFGHLSPGAPDTPIYTQEEPQEGERHFVIRRAGHARWVALSHRAPSGLHPDHVALQVLGKLLSHGQLSYLHRELIDQGQALAVYVDVPTLRDPGLISTYVHLTEDVTPEQVVQTILKVYHSIQNGLVSAEDLQRAKRQFLAERALERDGLQGCLETLNEGIACGDWRQGLRLAEAVSAVSLEQLQDVSRRYWVLEQQVTGFFLPKESK